MGYLVNAKCDKCRFATEFCFGGGMLGFDKVCKVPAIDHYSKEFVVENYFKKYNFRRKITFYNDPFMFQPDSKKPEYIEFGEILLAKRGNLCPKCKTYNLNFKIDMIFD